MTTYTQPNRGVCSRSTTVQLNDDGTIHSVQVVGGCNGNLKGICALLQGMPVEEAAARLTGITCGYKNTSCPDQVARALRAAREQQQNG